MTSGKIRGIVAAVVNNGDFGFKVENRNNEYAELEFAVSNTSDALGIIIRFYEKQGLIFKNWEMAGGIAIITPQEFLISHMEQPRPNVLQLFGRGKVRTQAYDKRKLFDARVVTIYKRSAFGNSKTFLNLKRLIEKYNSHLHY